MPEREFLPLSTRAPAAVLVKPLVPARGAITVAVFWFTAIEGDGAEAVSRVSMFPPLAPSAQFWLPEVSPNLSVPMLREVFRVTARSAVMLSVLKSAVKPAPLAMMPPLQLLVSLQLPLASVLQVPLASEVAATDAVSCCTLPPGPGNVRIAFVPATVQVMLDVPLAVCAVLLPGNHTP